VLLNASSSSSFSQETLRTTATQPYQARSDASVHNCSHQTDRCKVGEQTIAIIKNLPVSQCGACREYLMTDPVFARVEKLLAGVNTSVELEIIQFAA
jgi:hypothetical protein